MGLALVVLVYISARQLGLMTEAVRSLSYLAIIAVIFALLLSDRSTQNIWRRGQPPVSRSLWFSLGAVIVLVTVLLTVAPLSRFLQLGALQPLQVAAALGSGVLLLLMLETAKAWRRH
jgi:hypothetical protein